MSWNDFVVEFNTTVFNMRAINAQQRYFNNLKQGSMTLIKVATKFSQLARFCSHLVPTKEERVRSMMEMFKPELIMAIDSTNQLFVTMSNYVERTLRAEYRLTQVKEELA